MAKARTGIPLGVGAGVGAPSAEYFKVVKGGNNAPDDVFQFIEFYWEFGP